MTGRGRFNLAIVALLAALMVGGLLLALWPRKPGRSYRLRDGSVLRVEHVELGKHGNLLRYFDPSMGWLAEAKVRLGVLFGGSRGEKLIESVHGYLTSTGMEAPEYTNLDTLRVWLVNRDGAGGALRNFEVLAGEVVDDHGHVFQATGIGGDYFGPLAGYPGRAFNCWSLTFAAFPRQEPKFRLRVLEGKSKEWAEFEIVNPAPAAKRKDMDTEPLPIARTNGGAEFTLTGVEMNARTNANSTNVRYEVVPKFEFRENGKPTTAWRAEGMELWDGWSNVSVTGYGYRGQSLYLSPEEPAWKLKVKFLGDEDSQAASNDLWVVRGVKVPGPGEFSVSTQTHDFGTELVTWQGFAGPGAVEYLRTTLVGNSNLPPGDTNETRTRYSRKPNGALIAEIPSTGWQMVVQVTGGRPDQALTVRAVDAEGRSYYADEWINGVGSSEDSKAIHYINQWHWQNNGPMILVLRLPPGVKSVDLYFCIHNAKTEEFVFKPTGTN